MSKLYFENKFGQLQLINKEATRENAEQLITQYVKRINPDYKIYYIRSWSESPDQVRYDVGSHTEFFLLIDNGEEE